MMLHASNGRKSFGFHSCLFRLDSICLVGPVQSPLPINPSMSSVSSGTCFFPNILLQRRRYCCSEQEGLSVLLPFPLRLEECVCPMSSSLSQRTTCCKGNMNKMRTISVTVTCNWHAKWLPGSLGEELPNSNPFYSFYHRVHD